MSCDVSVLSERWCLREGTVCQPGDSVTSSEGASEGRMGVEGGSSWLSRTEVAAESFTYSSPPLFLFFWSSSGVWVGASGLPLSAAVPLGWVGGMAGFGIPLTSS